MIRTVIEVQGEDQWKFEQNLRTVLGQLGFEAKQSEESVTWRCHLFSGLKMKGIDPVKIVEEYREKLQSEQTT